MDTLSQLLLPLKEQKNSQNEALEHFLYAQKLEAAPIDAQELMHLTLVDPVLPKVRTEIWPTQHKHRVISLTFIFHAMLVLTMNQCQLAQFSVQ